MKNTTKSLLGLGSAIALLVTAAGMGASATDAPKPAPAAANPSLAIGEPYKVLLTRSIFSRDGRAAVVQYRSSNWTRAARPASTQPATEPAITPNPEADYILRGVGIEDGVVTAFFEQTSESKGVSRHIGQAVARGQITAMSLDGIEYLLNAKTAHIVIGQALDGRMIDVPASTTSSTPSSGGSDKPSWWGRHSHTETPAVATPGTATPGSPPAAHDSDERHSRDEHRSGDDHRPPAPGDAPTQKPTDPGPPPDDGTDPIIIIDSR